LLNDLPTWSANAGNMAADSRRQEFFNHNEMHRVRQEDCKRTQMPTLRNSKKPLAIETSYKDSLASSEAMRSVRK
jgi:hypothetical protein